MFSRWGGTRLYMNLIVMARVCYGSNREERVPCWPYPLCSCKRHLRLHHTITNHTIGQLIPSSVKALSRFTRRVTV
jgi:hypothetical protein